MAALKLTLDSLDGVEDAHKPLYVEDNGKFKLAVDGLDDTSGLKSALQKERRDRAELEKKVKKWEGLGKSDEEVLDLIAKHDETTRTEAERKGEWEKLKGQMNSAHADALKAKDETIGQMRKRLEAELVDAKAVTAIAAANGNPKLLLKVVKDFVKVDDDFNVIVVDGKGDPRVNGKGEPLSISDLITELRSDNDYGQAFKGSGQSGSGTPPVNGSGGSPQRHTRRSEFSKEERIAFVDAYGGDAWFALPK